MPDMPAATDLKLYIDNDSTLYGRMTTPILKNLTAKKARGQYRHDLAVKGFGYLTEAGAKKYAQEYGSGPWHKMFDAATRKRAAEELTKDFETEYALGNYDGLIPKKYQKQARGAAPIKPRYPQGDEGRDKPYHGPSEDYPRTPSRHARKKTLAERLEALRPIEARRHANTAARETASAPSGRDIWEFGGFLRNATDRQVQGIYSKEKAAGRTEYAELAVDEAKRRGIDLGEDSGRNDHARRKQLDREILQVVPSYRGVR